MADPSRTSIQNQVQYNLRCFERLLLGSLAMAAVLFGDAEAQATPSPMETVKDTVVTVMGSRYG